MKPERLKSDKDRKDNMKEVSMSLMAFTFFYSVSIFAILLSFLRRQWNKDIKPEK